MTLQKIGTQSGTKLGFNNPIKKTVKPLLISFSVFLCLKLFHQLNSQCVALVCDTFH